LATRTRTTFAKRQKEQARQEKQRAKVERRLQKKLEPKNTGEQDESAERIESDEAEPAPMESGAGIPALTISTLSDGQPNPQV